MNKIALLFAGQGAQTVGMGRDVAAEFPAAAELWRQADATLEPGPGTLSYPQTATGPMLGRFSARSTNHPDPLSPTTSPFL